jgi:hypothetical protein
MKTADNISAHHRLVPLGDQELIGEEFKIKGWTVVLAHNEVVGIVEELLYNPESGKVRYLVLDVDDACTTMNCDRVLIPIGIAELHAEEDIVVLIGVGYEHLERLPGYTYEALTEEMEMAIRLVFGPATHEEFATFDATQFYSDQQFDSGRLYGSRNGNKQQ